MPAWPTEIPDSPPPEVLHDLDGAACVLAELEARGIEIALALEPTGLRIRAREREPQRERVLSPTMLLDLLVAPGATG